MPTLSVFDQLVVHPFLAGLPADRLQRLAAHGRPVLRHTGYRLFPEDGPADRFWLLRTGVVALDFQISKEGVAHDVVIVNAIGCPPPDDPACLVSHVERLRFGKSDEDAHPFLRIWKD